MRDEHINEWRDGRNLEERTELTDGAMRWALACVKFAARDATVVEVGASLMIEAYGYLTIVVGQPSATAHGKQGLHPDRIASLRAFDIPVRIVFWDGGKWQAVWLDINEPSHASISQDPAHPRDGWWVRDMIRAEGQLYFPERDEVIEDAAKQKGAPPNLFDAA